MSEDRFRIGAVFPQTEIGADPVAIRDFVQAIEGLGFGHLVAYDHVIGANPRNRPDWKGFYTHETSFLEPLVLFSHLAAMTSALEFMTGVIILPQRQTVLFGKQAATLDILCGGRLRLGVGLGWNNVEYAALDIPFERRGARMDEQLRLLRRLWRESCFTDSSSAGPIEDAGIKPLPLQRPIPLWTGGVSPAAMKRAARLADGWLPTLPVELAEERMAEFRELVTAAGRDPAQVPVEDIVFLGNRIGGGIRSPEAAVRDAEVWRQAGARGLALDTLDMGLQGPDEHIAVFRRLAELFDLRTPE